MGFDKLNIIFFLHIVILEISYFSLALILIVNTYDLVKGMKSHINVVKNYRGTFRLLIA